MLVPEQRFRDIELKSTMKYLLRDLNDITCTQLNPSGRGYLMCSENNNSQNTQKDSNRPGTKCHLKCPYGYELHGEYELTCRNDGTWDGPKHGECVRKYKSKLLSEIITIYETKLQL